MLCALTVTLPLELAVTCVDLLTASSRVPFSLNTGYGIKSALLNNN